MNGLTDISEGRTFVTVRRKEQSLKKNNNCVAEESVVALCNHSKSVLDSVAVVCLEFNKVLLNQECPKKRSDRQENETFSYGSFSALMNDHHPDGVF